VEAIKEEVRSPLTVEIKENIKNDIMAMLRDQTVHIRSPSMTRSLVDGRKSSVLNLGCS
jgi:hypothetical protein